MRPANPLSNIDGHALRQQGLFLSELPRNLPPLQQQTLKGLINFMDEIRSYCHDEYGVDCLLRSNKTDNNGPCAICGAEKGCPG